MTNSQGPLLRARQRIRLSVAAAGTVLAVAAAGVPLAAGTADAAPSHATSAWGHHADAKAKLPQIPVGTNRPVVSDTHLTATASAAARRAHQAATGTVSPLVAPPSGQGQVPWHQYSNTRLTDSLVARVDLSSGDLMLAGTDFDIAGAGDRLQLTRTYSSFTGVGGTLGSRWWASYDRRLQVSGSDVYAIDSTGGSAHFTASGTSGAYTTPAGYSQDLVKNSDGTYSLTDRKSGSKDTYTSAGVLAKVTDRNGAVITVAQHSGGGYKLTEARTGRFIDLAPYTTTQWRATDNTGRYATFDTDGYGNLVKTTDTAGKATFFGYESLSDTEFRVNKITSPEGNITKISYDGSNRVRSLQRITDKDAGTGPSWTYGYSAAVGAAGTTTATDPKTHATVYTVGAAGQVTKVTDARQNSRSATYDANHNVATAVDAMGSGGGVGNTTVYKFDSRNNPRSATLPTGASAAFGQYATKAGMDVPPDFTDAQGNKTSYSYDAVGNTLSEATSGSGGASAVYTYNPASPTCGGFAGQRCTSRDRDNQVTTFHYDSAGNLDKVTPPAPLAATTYTYDALGRPRTVTDGRGITTTYVYDDRDRTTSVSTSGGAGVSYSYDDDGFELSRSDASGTTSYVPDALGRETLRTLPDQSTTSLSYDPAGNVETYTDPTGPVVYTYDDANNPHTVKDPSGGLTTYTYNNDDIRTGTAYPGNTVQTVIPDNSGRPSHIRTVAGSTVLVDLSYDYTSGPGGQDGSDIHTRTDNQAGKTITYKYDAQDRLNFASETGGASWLYCYDSAGNLHSASGATVCPGTTTYTYNNASELTGKNGTTTGWSYNPVGDETAGASSTGPRTGEAWSDFNQLTSLTVAGTTYPAAYSGTDNGERTQLGATTFHNGPEGLAASTTAGVDTGFTRDAQGTLNSMRTGGKSYYYLTDAQGSVLGLVDNAAHRVDTYTYGPNGLPRAGVSETVPQPYRFQGAYLDPTGLYKMGARYYDPVTTRFTQTDPSGKETNPYAALGNNPVNNTDPNGTSKVCDVVAWGGSSAGVVIGVGSDIGGFIIGFGGSVLTADCIAGADEGNGPEYGEGGFQAVGGE
ncbi:RHS repeat domain-containing protein [Streptomyces sp. CA-111067]|uniref:RHS repeat domain-containing protein n=1 Tax=Streptomyces sp. CA-111067 TaxID=3240046 RepID=UPI003D99B01F